MNNKMRLAISCATILYSLTSLAQDCPRSIETDHVLRGNLPDWNALDKSSVHLLSGLKVVEEKLHSDEGENAVLAPDSDSGEDYMWPFRAEVGDEELWMLCLYRDTPVRLSRRIASTAKECRVKKAASDVGAASVVMRAFCE